MLSVIRKDNVYLLLGWLTSQQYAKLFSRTDLLRHFHIRSHWDRKYLSNLLSHPFTVYWHWANQSSYWSYNARHHAGLPPEYQFQVTGVTWPGLVGSHPKPFTLEADTSLVDFQSGHRKVNQGIKAQQHTSSEAIVSRPIRKSSRSIWNPSSLFSFTATHSIKPSLLGFALSQTIYTLLVSWLLNFQHACKAYLRGKSVKRILTSCHI